MLDFDNLYCNSSYGFKVKVLEATSNPQRVIYQALHQDYSPDWIGNQKGRLTEKEYGTIAVEALLSGNKGHFGSLEHPQIVFSCGYINHGTVQQLRTHRNVSFGVQSMRYTSEQFLDVILKLKDIEEVIFFRPVGEYQDRNGRKFSYTESDRQSDIEYARIGLERYAHQISTQGFTPEFARGMIPFDYRQHFVFSGNLRAMLHVLDLRAKADAQDEIVVLMELIYHALCDWSPEIMDWYTKHRYKKARLAP